MAARTSALPDQRVSRRRLRDLPVRDERAPGRDRLMALATAHALDGLIAALFVIFGLGIIVARQMLGALYLFMCYGTCPKKR